MTLFDKLAQERRARLAAERQLERRTRDLDVARAEIEALSRNLAEERKRLSARERDTTSDAGERAKVRADLDAAHRHAVMAERRLWDSVNTIRDGFAVFNREHRLVIANQAYLRPFTAFPEVQPGITYRRLLELIAVEGMMDFDGMQPQEWVEHMLGRWQADPIPPVTLELGTAATIRVIDRRARGGDIVSVVHDITEAKRHELELEEARQRAEAANRTKSAFLANMSHEIRTPLNGVLGMSQLLARTQLDERQQKMIATVQSSGRALLSIINDILDISKIEAGLMTLDPEPAVLAGICDQALAAVTATAQEKGLDLSVSIAPDLPETIEVDHRRLGQVLINLLGNAVKFTEAGSVKLVVRALDAAHIRFEVIDTGPGITPAQRAIIFDRFRQLDASFSRAHEGAGLGLALSREFAELMGGEISVESEPGEGASFRLDLPLMARRSGVPDTAGLAKRKRWRAPRAARILLAEDNATNRETLVMFLQELGLQEPVCAANGQEALEAARAQDFALVIMDISMPVLSGLDAIAAIRSGKDCRARVPILALTAHASSEDRDQCLKAGANEYLAKPVDLDALAGALSRLLNVKAGG